MFESPRVTQPRFPSATPGPVEPVALFTPPLFLSLRFRSLPRRVRFGSFDISFRSSSMRASVLAMTHFLLPFDGIFSYWLHFLNVSLTTVFYSFEQPRPFLSCLYDISIPGPPLVYSFLVVNPCCPRSWIVIPLSDIDQKGYSGNSIADLIELQRTSEGRRTVSLLTGSQL